MLADYSTTGLTVTDWHEAILVNQFGKRSAAPGAMYTYIARGLGPANGVLSGWTLLWCYLFIGTAGLTGFVRAHGAPVHVGDRQDKVAHVLFSAAADDGGYFEYQLEPAPGGTRMRFINHFSPDGTYTETPGDFGGDRRLQQRIPWGVGVRRAAAGTDHHPRRPAAGQDHLCQGDGRADPAEPRQG